MSVEGSANNPGQNQHPEITGNPEAIQPAEQVTLRHVMAVLANKTRGDAGKSRKTAILRGPDTGRTVILASHTEPNLYADKPQEVGSVQFRELGKGSNFLVTDYRLHEIPDGFTISKHVHLERQTSGLAREATIGGMRRATQKSGRYDGLQPPKSVDELLAEGKMIQLIDESALEKHNQAASKSLENQMGLSFVSEAETRSLLARITPLASKNPMAD